MAYAKISKEDLYRILEEHGTWLKTDGEEGRKADFSNADLTNANLREADLEGADLKVSQ